MRNPYADELVRRVEAKQAAQRPVAPASTSPRSSLVMAPEIPTIFTPGAYVTNATSRSVAFYVISFLNNQGYSPEQIVALRKQLHTERESGKFDIDEIQRCLIRQSVFFLELFIERFLVGFRPFLRDLEASDQFTVVFRYYKNAEELVREFERRTVYHTNYHCESMRKDYEDGERHIPNTGVFADSTVKRNEYLISRDYLDRLGMRLCKSCSAVEAVAGA